MKKVVTILNLKGGVGKTSSAVNLSTSFALMGKKVLIIDTDKQSNSTQYLDRYDESMKSTYHVFTGQCTLKEIIRETSIQGLDIAPATVKLVEIRDSHLKSKYDIISKQINRLEYDYIFFDCPPDLNPIVDNVLASSTDVIVPIKLDNWALLGFGYIIEKIQEIQINYNPNLRFTGAFITMDKARTKVSKESKKHLEDNLGSDLFKTCIRDNSQLVVSTFFQKPVVIYDKNCNSSKDYFNLANELLQKIQ